MPTQKEELQLNTQQDMSSEDMYVLKKLFTEYVSLYRLELNSGKYEILRLIANTNAKQIVGEEYRIFADYDEFTRRYAETFIPETEQEEFLDWHKCENLKKRLLEKERLTYYYHSVSKDGKDSYYEAYAVKGKTDGKNFYIFLGYRNVDSILYKEKAIQKQLQRALDEAKLSNEIIEAIAKSYQYISRIDISKNWFEEISNRAVENMNYKKSGEVTSGNRNVCKKFVAEEYQEAFLKFADITTLPVRMKNEETIVMEYQMKDGNWHKLRFIEKKRDKDGNLTHVLCAIRSISDVKKKEQELLQQVAEARKDAALKSRFLSNMSHDIRTPINGIIGMTELADRYPDNLEIQKKCREKLLESARHLVSMVNDILDMNKLESGGVVEQEIPFNLAVANRVFDPMYQNVFFELFIGFLILCRIEWAEKRAYGAGEMNLVCLYTLIGCGASILVGADYNAIGILMIVFLYRFRNSRRKQTAAAGVIGFLETLFPTLGAGALAAIPIWFYNGKRGKQQMKFLFYWFYPLHLLILFLIRWYFLGIPLE